MTRIIEKTIESCGQCPYCRLWPNGWYCEYSDFKLEYHLEGSNAIWHTHEISPFCELEEIVND